LPAAAAAAGFDALSTSAALCLPAIAGRDAAQPQSRIRRERRQSTVALVRGRDGGEEEAVMDTLRKRLLLKLQILCRMVLTK
jgi:hypothetical protein